MKSFDRLCEVQSDKATVEITSRYDGIVREVYHSEGAVVKVGAVLVDIETPPAHMISPKLNNLETQYEIPPELTDGFLDLDLLNMKEEQNRSDRSSEQTNSGVSSINGENLNDMKDFLQWQKDLDMQPIDQQHQHQQRNGHALSSSHANKANDIVLATPAVRGLAKELSVDLADVSSINGGRVTEDDVLKYVASRQPQPTNVGAKSTLPSTSSSPSTATTGWRWRELENVQQNGKGNGMDNRSLTQRRRPAAAPMDVPQWQQQQQQQQQPSSSSKVVPIRGIQRAMAKTMMASLKVPSLTYSDDVECDALLRLRKRLNSSVSTTRVSAKDNNNSSSVEQQQAVTKISSMPIILKALSLALTLHPTINSTVECPECSQVVLHAHHHIGVAMDTKQGLLVPVVKHVQSKSVFDIAAELASLQQAAASGRGLSEDQLSGGTFTVSNIGSIGGTTVTPVVLVPQVAILALGKMRVVPRYSPRQAEQVMRGNDDGDLAIPQPTPMTVMCLSISADHRVLDGAAVARFSNTLKSFLEDPSLMLTHLR